MFFLGADFGEGDPLNGTHVYPQIKGPGPMGPSFGGIICLIIPLCGPIIPLKGLYFAITGRALGLCILRR